jgi:hypothetical protein
MTEIRIFQADLFDRASGAPMRLAAWRCHDAADHPFYLDADGSRWMMTLDEVSRLGIAARIIERRIARTGEKSERPVAGAVFRRKLSPGDVTVQAIIELGLAGVEETVAVYFEFARKRVHLSEEQGARLLELLARLGEWADLRKAQPGGGQLLVRPDRGFLRGS